jgi:acetyltransferase-like isoleucine patch superfamily enzyme
VYGQDKILKDFKMFGIIRNELVRTMKTKQSLFKFWQRFWMHIAEYKGLRKIGMRIAAWSVAPYKSRISLSDTYPCGFIESNAIIHHPGLKIGKHCFIGRDVVIFERKNGGHVKLDDRVQINRGSVIETGRGGYISIGYNSSIHPCCHIYAYLSPITIGSGVMLAPNCALYSYDHGLVPEKPIRTQPLITKGAIVIGDEAWLGFGTVVLSGVKIGKGAAIGAGSVVTSDIPDNAIAAGNPARVIKMRTRLTQNF